MSESAGGADESDPVGARHVFAVGVAEYADPNWTPLPQVCPDVASVIEVLGSLGYSAASAARTGLINPSEGRDIELLLLRWLRDHFGFDDTLVIYHAGHGVAERDHYLICAETEYDTAALKVTALPTARLVELAGDAGVQRLLVIVDACYAGDGAAAVLAQTAKSHLVAASAARGDQNKHWKCLAVLSAARSGEVADDGAFARILSDVLQSVAGENRILAGERPEFIHLSDVVREINREFAGQALPQRADLAVIHDDGTGFLPNPRYVAGLSNDFDLAEQRVASEQRRLREKELVEHFGPRGVGVHGPDEAGHYFTGRTEVLTRLARWLRGESERNVRLYQVTGGPGTGKSSILGRLVTRSDPTTRHTIPDETVIVSTDVPPHTIDLAIHAAGKQLADVLAALGDVLGVPTYGVTDILAALKGLRRSFTLVIDALDEASTHVNSLEAEVVHAFLLRATALAPDFRVLLGARPDVLPNGEASHDALARIDLDDPRWIARRDIMDYAAQLLSAPHGPGSSSGLSDRLIERAAPEIGRVTFPNYLVTRIVARALADPSRAFWDADPAAWASLLPVPLEETSSTRPRPRRSGYYGIGPAFLWARNIQLTPEQVPLYRAVLLSLAYTEGAGLPLPGVWASIAGALYGEPVSEQQITEILNTDAAAAYVTEAMDARGRSVYRLYHQALVDNLRRGHQNGVTDYLLKQPGSWGVVHSKQVRRVIARTIYEALIDSVYRTPGGARDWQDADPYLLDHLMAHAATANRVDELLVDAEFLVHADVDGVAPFLQMAESEDAVRAAKIYRASLGQHRKTSADIRRWVLALDATRLEDHEFAERLRQPSPSLVPWPHWNTASLRPGLLRSIYAGASMLTVVADWPIAITAGPQQSVQCWNLNDGQLLTEIDTSESGSVTALASTVQDERGVLITGHANGDVRAWDLSDDVPRSRRMRSGDATERAPVIAVGCAVAHDRVFALGTGSDGVTRIWDTQMLDQVSSLPSGPEGDAQPTVVTLYGSPDVATALPGGGFSLWELPHGAPLDLDDDYSAAAGVPTALTAAVLNERPAVITGNANGELHRWFVSSSRVVLPGLPDSGLPGGVAGDRIRTVTATPTEDTVIAVTGHHSGLVQLWDLEGGGSITLPGHRASVHTASTTELDTGLAAVTADDAGLVNIWDLQPASSVLHSDIGVSALACTPFGSRTITVTGHTDGHIGLWDTRRGSSSGRHAGPTPDSGVVTSISCARLASQTLVATAYAKNLLRFWNLADPDAVGSLVTVEAPAEDLDCAHVGRSAVAITGHVDGSVRLWDLASQTHLAELLAPGASPVTSVACTGRGSAIGVTGHADGSCRTWDLKKHMQLSETVPTEPVSVRAVAMSRAKNGDLALVGHADGRVMVRDALTGDLRGTALTGEGSELVSLACVVREGRPFALAGHRDGTLDLFDLAAQVHVQSVPVSLSVDAMDWSADGFLSMAAGSELYVLETREPRPPVGDGQGTGAAAG
ncbi:WD40 repeat domain-containing protein [Streptomyces tibetensis]|uniref:WD40 repeat domain-containing protein n=1 Tax=Streptomyces tibetensis TaxID=2382123 RepID=UPI0033EE6176